MSAPNPTGGEREFDALRRAQRAHEPSMEEILASIRAIIADDRVAEPAKPVAAPKPAASAGPQIVYSNDSAPSLRAVSEPESVPAENAKRAGADHAGLRSGPSRVASTAGRSAPLSQAGTRTVDPDARNLAGPRADD